MFRIYGERVLILGPTQPNVKLRGKGDIGVAAIRIQRSILLNISSADDVLRWQEGEDYFQKADEWLKQYGFVRTTAWKRKRYGYAADIMWKIC